MSLHCSSDFNHEVTQGEYCPECGSRLIEAAEGEDQVLNANTNGDQLKNIAPGNDVEKDGTDSSTSTQAVYDKLAFIEVELTELRRLFEERLKYDQAKEAALVILSNKLEELAPSYQYSLKKGFIKSLINFYDRIKDVENTFPVESDERSKIAALSQELLDKMYAEDVELIERQREGLFNSKIQRAVRKIETSDSSKNLTVAEIVQDGFMQNDKVIRPQSVIVRRFQSQAEN